LCDAFRLITAACAQGSACSAAAATGSTTTKTDFWFGHAVSLRFRQLRGQAAVCGLEGLLNGWHSPNLPRTATLFDLFTGSTEIVSDHQSHTVDWLSVSTDFAIASTYLCCGVRGSPCNVSQTQGDHNRERLVYAAGTLATQSTAARACLSCVCRKGRLEAPVAITISYGLYVSRSSTIRCYRDGLSVTTGA
jgi:hypothetical protein